MNREDSLRFVQTRLRHNRGGLRDLRWFTPERVKRRFAAAMARGEARRFDVDRSVMLSCASGSLWITVDGDPKDVILGPRESYQADRDGAMHVFALQPCTLEIEFEDDVIADH